MWQLHTDAVEWVAAVAVGTHSQVRMPSSWATIEVATARENQTAVPAMANERVPMEVTTLPGREAGGITMGMESSNRSNSSS